ncbi:energy-coupling factor transporter transmembrane component T family protein [Streptococcus cuniculipharyngis]|uniref:Energy-coupling factor transporter transmembrane protein EcfT n=1 Tax=Streptococcus cuniculipharyngis TaxID=1562651 RepID=A0A5C5SD05_9STRE|nr:energy-coupling factor transporter transmembrane component T [Streptococcus cuniculipharyngis]TWS98162.1 energy-coupling factor transporter transmembrane protein EcfT [Streptococcus cuniculipharyngis]
MVGNKLLGYQAGNSFLHQLSGASKLIFFVLVSIAAMVSYDTRLIAVIALGSLVLFQLSGVKWREISLVLYLVLIFSALNLLMVYLFAPNYGGEIYGQSTFLWKGIGSYQLTWQELFYLFNLMLKYFCTVPLALIFLMTTQPSQFAASLNQIGLPYRIAYAVSLTMRYIPDLQEEFYMIKLSQNARGLDLSKKASLIQRIKGNLQILAPLIFSSLERIDTVATAMELRRFGKGTRRTWYRGQALAPLDFLVIGLAVLLLVISFGLIVLNQGRFYNPWA